MDIAKQLLAENSRANIDYIASCIKDDENHFKQLMDLVFCKDPILPQKASWVVDVVTTNYPGIILPYIPRIITKLNDKYHQGVKRDLLRVISTPGKGTMVFAL